MLYTTLLKITYLYDGIPRNYNMDPAIVGCIIIRQDLCQKYQLCEAWNIKLCEVFRKIAWAVKL